MSESATSIITMPGSEILQGVTCLMFPDELPMQVEGPGSSSIVQMLKGGALIVTVKKGSDAADPHSGLAANMVRPSQTLTSHRTGLWPGCLGLKHLCLDCKKLSQLRPEM